MKTFKKVLAVILSIMMIASVIVLPASAEITAETPFSELKIDDFETDITGSTKGVDCDFATSGARAAKLTGYIGNSYVTVQVNKNANYIDAEGISFWVYNAEDTTVNIYVSLASTANVGATGKELYYQRKYSNIEPKTWTKLYFKFDGVSKQIAEASKNTKWQHDSNNTTYNYNMTDEEISGITNLYFAVANSQIDRTLWFDDVYLWDDGKIENETIELTESNVTLPAGATYADGKVTFAPGASANQEVIVSVPAGTLANTTSIEYHYTTSANATPDVFLRANASGMENGANGWQIKLGYHNKSSWNGSTKLTANTTSSHVMQFSKVDSTKQADNLIYTRNNTSLNAFINYAQPATYSVVPTEECKNAITQIRFMVYPFSTADSGEYVTLDKIVLTYDNPEFTSSAVEAENGTVTMFNNGGYANEIIGFTATPVNACYAIDTVTVTDAEGNAVEITQGEYDAANLDNYYTFIQPASNATVNVTFKFLGHTVVVDEAVAATCTTTGLTEGSHCSVCGVTIVAQEVVDALGHEWVDGEITYTDCTSDGVQAQSCSRCDATQTVTVAPKGHTEVDVEAVAPTCTKTGLTAGVKCSVCGAFTVPQEVIPALGHTEGTPVDKGNGTHTVSCSVCGVTLRTENHNYVDGTCGCGNATYLLTDFETTVTGESAGETCDFAVSGTQATKLADAHSYKTVKVNKNANYKDAEGISFWVYNAEDSAVSVWANLASTANMDGTTELYFQRKYTVEPKVWTKLYIKFDYVNKQTAASSTNKKWGFDANNIAYNRAMTDEEIAGITNLYFAVDGGALKTVWFDDVYLWDNGKIENKTIELTESNVTLPAGATFADGKVTFAPGASANQEVIVSVPAGTLATASSIEYHYTTSFTTNNATPQVQLYAAGPVTNNNAHQIKLGQGTISQYDGKTQLEKNVSSVFVMDFGNINPGTSAGIYSWYGATSLKNVTMDASYGVEPTEACKNAITEIRFKVNKFSEADSGDYVTLDKIVINYDKQFTSTAAETENGSVTMFNNGGYAGDVIGFTATPVNSCYVVDTVTVKDAAGKAVTVTQGDYDAINLQNYYCFVQPTSNATVSVTFKLNRHVSESIIDNGDADTHTVTCNVCGESRTETHTFVNGGCVCGYNPSNFVTSFEADESYKAGESEGEACDFAASGTQAAKLAEESSYKTVKVNKNRTYKKASGITFWVYNAEDSAVSIWASLASTANVGSSGEELYYQRKYTVQPKAWTKLYLEFGDIHKQLAVSDSNTMWSIDQHDTSKRKFNYAMIDEEIVGITNLYFAVDGGAQKTVWFDDVYLWNNNKLDDRIIDSFSSENSWKALGSHHLEWTDDGKVKFVPGQGTDKGEEWSDQEIGVYVDAGTLATASSIEYHYTTNLNEGTTSPSFQLYAKSKKAAAETYGWQVKLGQGVKSTYNGKTQLESNTSSVVIMDFLKVDEGAASIYSWYGVTWGKYDTLGAQYAVEPSEACKNALEDIRFKVTPYGTADSGEYVILDKMVINYDKQFTATAANTENGSVNIFNDSVFAGDRIGFTVTPINECYVVDTVTVTDAEGNTITTTQVNTDGKNLTNYYTYSQPASNTTIKVTFKLDTHKGVTVDEAVAATCTETGLTEGSHCSVCGETIVAQQVVPALGHAWVTTKTENTGCNSTNIEHQECSRCGETQTVAGDISGHTNIVDYEDVAPTCTTVGYTGGQYCKACNAVIEARTVVPATGHTEVVDAAVAATCTTTGLTKGSHCSVCNEVLVAQQVVPALGHTEGTPVQENIIEAQPGKTGSYDSVVYCTVCNTELSRTPIVIPALPTHVNTLRIEGFNGSFASSYSLIYYIKESDVKAYDEFKIKLSREKFYKNSDDEWVLSDEKSVTYLTMDDIRCKEDGTPNFLVAGKVNYYQFELKGIAPKEVANDIVANIVATKDGKEYYGDGVNLNLVTYALNYAKNTPTYPSESYLKFQEAMINFLNYAAEAQEYFGYNNATEADLANAELTGEQKVVNLTKELTDDAKNEGSGEINIAGFNVGFESQIELLVYLKPVNGDYNGKTLVISYKDAFGGLVTDRIDLTDITETMDVTDENDEVIATFLVVRYAGIAAKDMRTVVSMYVEDENGTKISNDRSYSLTTYAKKQAEAGSSIAVLTNALMAFGDAMNAWKTIS